MHLASGEPVEIQVVEARVCELAVERSKLGQIEGILRPVVEAGQQADQAARLAGRRISADRILDGPQRTHRAR